MNSRISQLLSQITALEDELRTALHEQESHLFYQFKDGAWNSRNRSAPRTAN
jgi:hypothetical protein